MPPKAKFTREEIISAALDIVRADGIPALTARSLGGKLGSSARPIFTIFQNMEEVQQETIQAARGLYNQYVQKGLDTPHPFKGVGTQYIRFAMEEPKLFQLLFMHEQSDIPDLSGILPQIDENYPKILKSIQTERGVSASCAQWLYRHLWIYTHGIASLCATNMCHFTGEEISQMITDIFVSLLKNTNER